MRVAILGGTFDPVHIGHLFIADEVLFRLDYDRVIFVPTRVPPHKDTAPRAAGGARADMLKIAVIGRTEFLVDTFEVEQEEVSYTLATLRHLYKSLDLTSKPGLIIGEDLVAGFEQWRGVDEIVERAELILVKRPGSTPKRLGRPHKQIDNLMLEISATEIRNRISRGLPVRYLLPHGVWDYVEEHGLYR